MATTLRRFKRLPITDTLNAVETKNMDAVTYSASQEEVITGTLSHYPYTQTKKRKYGAVKPEELPGTQLASVMSNPDLTQNEGWMKKSISTTKLGHYPYTETKKVVANPIYYFA